MEKTSDLLARCKKCKELRVISCKSDTPPRIVKRGSKYWLTGFCSSCECFLRKVLADDSHLLRFLSDTPIKSVPVNFTGYNIMLGDSEYGET